MTTINFLSCFLSSEILEKTNLEKMGFSIQSKHSTFQFQFRLTSLRQHLINITSMFTQPKLIFIVVSQNRTPLHTVYSHDATAATVTADVIVVVWL